jgi:hypothetical protein
MNELEKKFARQAQWQTNRKALSWPDKVRQAEAIRDSIEALREGKPELPPSQAAGTATQRFFE